MDVSRRGLSGPSAHDKTEYVGYDDNRNRVVRSVRYTNIIMILHSFLVLSVALLDMGCFFYLQVFLADIDFFCEVVSMDGGRFSFSGQKLGRVIFVSIIVSLYAVILFNRMVFIQRKHIWKILDWRNHIDLKLVIVFSALLLGLHAIQCHGDYNFNELSFSERLWSHMHIVMHFIRVIFALMLTSRLKTDITQVLRTAISMNKRRFIENEINLDLTYICDRVIAMVR